MHTVQLPIPTILIMKFSTIINTIGGSDNHPALVYVYAERIVGPESLYTWQRKLN